MYVNGALVTSTASTRSQSSSASSSFAMPINAVSNTAATIQTAANSALDENQGCLSGIRSRLRNAWSTIRNACCCYRSNSVEEIEMQVITTPAAAATNQADELSETLKLFWRHVSHTIGHKVWEDPLSSCPIAQIELLSHPIGAWTNNEFLRYVSNMIYEYFANMGSNEFNQLVKEVQSIPLTHPPSVPSIIPANTFIQLQQYLNEENQAAVNPLLLNINPAFYSMRVHEFISFVSALICAFHGYNPSRERLI